MSTTNGLVGKSVKRVEDKRFITGNGKYSDDDRAIQESTIHFKGKWTFGQCSICVIQLN